MGAVGVNDWALEWKAQQSQKQEPKAGWGQHRKTPKYAQFLRRKCRKSIIKTRKSRAATWRWGQEIEKITLQNSQTRLQSPIFGFRRLSVMRPVMFVPWSSAYDGREQRQQSAASSTELFGKSLQGWPRTLIKAATEIQPGICELTATGGGTTCPSPRLCRTPRSAQPGPPYPQPQPAVPFCPISSCGRWRRLLRGSLASCWFPAPIWIINPNIRRWPPVSPSPVRTSSPPAEAEAVRFYRLQAEEEAPIARAAWQQPYTTLEPSRAALGWCPQTSYASKAPQQSALGSLLLCRVSLGAEGRQSLRKAARRWRSKWAAKLRANQEPFLPNAVRTNPHLLLQPGSVQTAGAILSPS